MSGFSPSLLCASPCPGSSLHAGTRPVHSRLLHPLPALLSHCCRSHHCLAWSGLAQPGTAAQPRHMGHLPRAGGSQAPSRAKQTPNMSCPRGACPSLNPPCRCCLRSPCTGRGSPEGLCEPARPQRGRGLSLDWDPYSCCHSLPGPPWVGTKAMSEVSISPSFAAHSQGGLWLPPFLPGL